MATAIELGNYMLEIERTGEKFNLNQYLKGQKSTIQLIRQFAAKAPIGITEIEMAKDLEIELRNAGVEGFWHPTKIRFGANTVFNFREPLTETKLMNGDIFFIDVGPIIEKHEADFGESFIAGNNPALEKMSQASRLVFEATKAKWKKEHLTGEALYQFAAAEALKLGYELNLNMDGHRLGDFPHALYFKGSLAEVAHHPVANLWILEIHLIDRKNTRGAFYEDLL